MHGAYEHFKEGGWGMWPILFWSIITIGIIVERALYLFGSSINKDVFLATMQKCILAGDVAKAVGTIRNAVPESLRHIIEQQLHQVLPDDQGLLEADFGDWTGAELKRLYKKPEWRTVQRNPSGFRFPVCVPIHAATFCWSSTIE